VGSSTCAEAGSDGYLSAPRSSRSSRPRGERAAGCLDPDRRSLRRRSARPDAP
jgi:hypothetical protein